MSTLNSSALSAFVTSLDELPVTKLSQKKQDFLHQKANSTAQFEIWWSTEKCGLVCSTSLNGTNKEVTDGGLA